MAYLQYFLKWFIAVAILYSVSFDALKTEGFWLRTLRGNIRLLQRILTRCSKPVTLFFEDRRSRVICKRKIDSQRSFS